MVDEFKLPLEIIDRRVTKMKMISPSNREVDVGKTLSDREWIGMCRREVFDDYLRNRAVKNGASVSVQEARVLRACMGRMRGVCACPGAGGEPLPLLVLLA
jgi:flavin-dependent dehydrogenase